MPTAITLSPSDDRRAIEGSGSRSGGATGQQRDGVQHRDGRGLEAGGRVAVLGDELPSVEHDEGVVRPRDREPVGRQHLELGAQAMHPAPEGHVQIAIGMGRDSARPVGAAGHPRRRGDHRERLRIEPLYPALDRRCQRPPARYVVAQRVKLSGLSPHKRVGRERVDGGQ